MLHSLCPLDPDAGLNCLFLVYNKISTETEDKHVDI